MLTHYLTFISEAIKTNWDKPAITNYGANTFTYGQMAEGIEKMHILFEKCGINKGEKIAICAKNSAEWCVVFLGIVTYDAVAVPLLADFLPQNIADLTKISDSRLLLIDKGVASSFSRNGIFEQFKDVEDFCGIINFVNEKVEFDNGNLQGIGNYIDETFAQRYPGGLTAADVDYSRGAEALEDLSIISYTSGTSSAPKGVMLQAKSLSGNIRFARDYVPTVPNGNTFSILPLAHIFGLSLDFLFMFSKGCHIHIFSAKPVPALLLKALSEVKPFLFLTVPLLIEKIFRAKVIPVLRKPAMRILTAIPGVRNVIYKKIRKTVLDAFGGNLHIGGFFIGGAAISKDVDEIMRKVKIPYAVGYGMTECGPLISYKGWNHPALKNNAGIIRPDIEVRIDSSSPATIPGEIQVRGTHVTAGYYKNPEATKAAHTDDGWFKTGDMGTMDANEYVIIRGRCKNMILTANGQNIYPEEIEEIINQQPLVMESLVVGRKHGLVALVVINQEAAKSMGVGGEELRKTIEDAVFAMNEQLPIYSRIAKCELREAPFEKTPKLSIKRFMYQ
ncbi:MAG: AMP-binding protein [Bacteroidaceae bacterium]|nr:AMP-binding protein [Bacteroidaceae bacterium]